MNEIWNVVHEERRALAADLAELEPDAWDTPSLCPGWTVHDVVAHLVNDAKTTWAGFARELLKARFDFDALNAQGVARERCADPRVTLANLRAVSGRTSSAPAPRVTRLVEAFVHGEDIRRPLGLRRNYPVAQLLDALKHQLATSTDFGGGRDRAAGVVLEATDADFRWKPSTPAVNSAPVVRGGTLALLLAVSGRPVRPGELDGEGASAFTVTSTDG
ncbi:maleylpyruvate isomerase family mycothiol-dependent enzyme [Arthrobacter sp. Y-9]|uniref:maleylpyruvate isomerase family mycothiol-dependent enzyme n=1 Tax=Arthrobacter sp. Y-9 TaxID=3039385 RepID=UPI00241C707A|nr:maleylpyruvate isomerase family mycothiol-dependent enzyme [Arthrobacter sp. Y-9]WFR84929.1 maleylpyruvate isomerase family mycothiol-dependent enzyme [Arthrobacter sp. Y-9]